MGNGLSRKRKIVKVMKLDGSTLKFKSPVRAAEVLEEYPGYNLLDSDDVTRSGVRAQPLEQSAPLKPGKLYFLIQLLRRPPAVAPDPRSLAGRAWSGALRVGAKERLESLQLSRRTMSDATSTLSRRLSSSLAVDDIGDGVLRLKMRLPKSQVEKLMRESGSPVETAEKIAELCVIRDGGAPQAPEPPISAVRKGRKEKRTRFSEIPDEIIA
ncbi:uncharacterized protein At1g66480-like [Zingiber officinale]|uniref:Uncharacterized protein n=1 Tax=Zingiber officinale TaxID=94328 RepID=A0A8J5KZB7_ZINOF|nr:uncharacterized protein At1g66480-like [Zingiber officinale]KAG6498552.1 hypothetical protein ZIOFF_038272 [Zingiber officinale]